jgi:molecular chaperone HtpG
MELNAGPPIVTQLYDRYKTNSDDPMVAESMELLFELALVAEGSEIADPVRLNRLTLELLQKSLKAA